MSVAEQMFAKGTDVTRTSKGLDVIEPVFVKIIFDADLIYRLYAIAMEVVLALVVNTS